MAIAAESTGEQSGVQRQHRVDPCSARPELSYLIADALSWRPDRMDSVEEYNEQTAAGHRDESAPDWDFGSAVCVDALTAMAMVVRGTPPLGAHRPHSVVRPPADARPFSIRQSVAPVGEMIRISSTRHPDLTELCDRVRRFVEDKPLLP